MRELVPPSPATTIDEVIQRMTEMYEALEARDGLACFNTLYLKVTQEIRGGPLMAAFEDVEFLDALDVTFANYYFDACAKVLRGEPCPPAWAPLLEHRDRSHTAPVQFALAGMNAHINHDLPLAIISTATDRLVEPFGGSRCERDFFRVNDVLADVESKIKSWFAVGMIGALDELLGSVDDAISMWCIHGARRVAWDNAALLWKLREHPGLFEQCERALTAVVNIAGRSVLI
jgi:Family of unknown function (DUF5995)